MPALVVLTVFPRSAVVSESRTKSSTSLTTTEHAVTQSLTSILSVVDCLLVDNFVPSVAIGLSSSCFSKVTFS